MTRGGAKVDEIEAGRPRSDERVTERPSHCLRVLRIPVVFVLAGGGSGAMPVTPVKQSDEGGEARVYLSQDHADAVRVAREALGK